MAASSATFSCLPEEVLEQIIFSCSTEDIEYLARVCKAISRVCSSRAVWMHFLTCSKIDVTPNVPPHVALEDLSAMQLREIVLDAEHRKQAWTTDKDVQLEHIELFQMPSEDPWRVNPRLLPGCKHVLLDHRGRLEVWSVERKARLWTAPAAAPYHSCVAFDFDMTEQGQKVNFAAWFERDDGMLYIRVFSYDFREDTGQVMLHRDFEARFIWKLMLRGRMLLVHMPHENYVFLVDIEKNSVVVLDYVRLENEGSNVNARCCLVQDRYVAIVTKNTDYILACLPISSLDGRWNQSSEQDDWDFVKLDAKDDPRSIQDDATRLSTIKIMNGDEPGNPWIAIVNAVSHPWSLESHSPRIAVIMFAPQAGSGGTNIFCTSHICVQLGDMGGESRQSDALPALSLLSQTKTPITDLPWYPQNVSHAGRMIALRKGKLNVYDLSSSKMQPGKFIDVPTLDSTTELNDGVNINSLEPWSESIAVGLPGRVTMIRLRKRLYADRRLEPLHDTANAS